MQVAAAHHIALCGMPRSGSSLLYLVLYCLVDSHWCQSGEYAHTAVLAALTGKPFDPPGGAEPNPDFYTPFEYIFYQPYDKKGEAVSGKPFISKQPYDIFRARDGLMPSQTDLVVTIRDPRDVLLSKHKAVAEKGVDDYFIDADYKYTFLHNGEPAKNGAGLLEYCRAIGDVLDCQRVGRRKILLCRYEDWLADLDAFQHRLEGMGIRLKPGAKLSDWNRLVKDLSPGTLPEEFGAAIGQARPITGPGKPKWKQPENHARIRQQFSAFPQLHRWVLRFGYETDESWIDQLG